MNVVIQRGPTSSKRRYHIDLAKTILNPVSTAERLAIVEVLSEGGYQNDADAIAALDRSWLWGGPRGIRRSIEGLRAGDINLFILDDEFVAASRVCYRFRDLDTETYKRIAGSIWQMDSYPEIWVMDYSVRIEPPFWRREPSLNKFTGSDLFFVRGRGALFPHQRVNIACLGEAWFERNGGVHSFLRLLGLKEEPINILTGGSAP